MQTPIINVYADRRWPDKTGIGRVQASIENAAPAGARIIDLKAAGPVGGPLSPLSLAWSLCKLSLFKASSDASLFFSAGFIPPLLSRYPTVIVVHDLIHLKYYGWAKHLYYQCVLRPLYKRCHAIVCVSEHTKQQLIAWGGFDPSKVHVIYNQVDAMFSPDGDKWQGEQDYVLYVGNHRNYKNLTRLVQAYVRSSLPRQSIRLVLTGPPNEELIKIAEAARVGSSIHFLGAVSDADLPRLYRGARAVAFVSLCEGFGLPIVEGMASGVPVMTSAISAMPEIAGDAALLVDPLSVDAIRDGLDRIVSDDLLRSRLIRSGQERVKLFERRASAAYWSLIRHVVQDSQKLPVQEGIALS